MPDTAALLAFALLLIVPGPTNTLLAASGAAVGFRRSCHLPIVEAAAYALAVALWCAWATAATPGVASITKGLAAAWLAWSAMKLWRAAAEGGGAGVISVRRVAATTMLNPKAMLAGTVLIPVGGDIVTTTSWLACWITMSAAAGAAWTAAGASIPRRLSAVSLRVSACGLAAFAAVSGLGAVGI